MIVAAPANPAIPVNPANPANLSQDTLISIGVGVGLSCLAVTMGIAFYLYNQRIAVVNELNSDTKPTTVTLRVLFTENPMRVKERKNSLTNNPDEDGHIV
jgi:hypothetical protein